MIVPKWHVPASINLKPIRGCTAAMLTFEAFCHVLQDVVLRQRASMKLDWVFLIAPPSQLRLQSKIYSHIL